MAHLTTLNPSISFLWLGQDTDHLLLASTMPFHIIFQFVIRAFLWITLFSVESFAPALYAMAPSSDLAFLAAITLSSCTFFALFFWKGESVSYDLQDLCAYEVLIWCFSWYLQKNGILASAWSMGLLVTIGFLRYGRLYWPCKDAAGERFVGWPTLGLVGWYAKRKGLVSGETSAAPNKSQTGKFFVFLALCLIAGYALPRLGILVKSWHIAVLAFATTPFIARRTLANMKRQQAAYEQSLEDAAVAREYAAAEKARANFQQELAAEKERSNQQLLAKNAEIEALLMEREKDKALLAKFNESLRDAAHDLQHPMAVVRIHADALMAMSEEEFWDKEKWGDVAQKLDIAIEEMTDMIDASVHSAQVVTGIVKPDVRVIDMNALLKKFNQLWLNGPNRRGLDYMLTYPVKHAGLYCPFDLIILKRILRNLIANAIQHSEPDKGILLAMRRRNGHCIIEVRDSGPGIPEGLGQDKVANFAAFASRIREEGSQVKQSGARSGYRLGMSNVLQLCAATGLDMQLCALPGRGSKFSFSLPLAHPDQLVETIHIRNAIDAQWKEASNLLEAYADAPMAEGEFFPLDDDLERHNLMPKSANEVRDTPG